MCSLELFLGQQQPQQLHHAQAADAQVQVGLLRPANFCQLALDKATFAFCPRSFTSSMDAAACACNAQADHDDHNDHEWTLCEQQEVLDDPWFEALISNNLGSLDDMDNGSLCAAGLKKVSKNKAVSTFSSSQGCRSIEELMKPRCARKCFLQQSSPSYPSYPIHSSNHSSLTSGLHEKEATCYGRNLQGFDPQDLEGFPNYLGYTSLQSEPMNHYQAIHQGHQAADKSTKKPASLRVKVLRRLYERSQKP